MWEIWKSTSGASQHLRRQLSAVETAQDKVFVTRKMVCTLWILGREVKEECMCVCLCSVMHTVIIVEDSYNTNETVGA